jgi:Domain of unknown function (DUF4062)
VTLQKWKVSVISTDLDLSETRSHLLDFLKTSDFEPIAFELPTMRVEPGVHSHQACVNAIGLADIVILLIDKRYGGLYLKNGPYSVTEEEFNRAYTQKKIIIPCTTRDLFNDRYYVKQKIKELKKTRNLEYPDARKLVTPQYADCIETIEFLDRLIARDRDQYLTMYSSSNELFQHLEGRLKGLSRYLCNLLARRESTALASSKSVSGLYDSLNSSRQPILIDSPFEIISGKTRRKSVRSILRLIRDKDCRLVITGNAGVGKSLQIITAFRSHVRSATQTSNWQLPFFVNLRGRGTQYHFSFRRYLNDSFAEYMGKQPYPFLDTNDIQPVFYIDGIDESSLIPSPKSVSLLASKDMLKERFVVACRTDFANRTIDLSTIFGSLVSMNIRLSDWNKATCLRYLQIVLKENNGDPAYIHVKQLIQMSTDDSAITTSPLLLVLLIWLVSIEDTMVSSFVSIQQIFSWFTHRWGIRELERYEKNNELIHIPNIESVLERCWNLAAWLVYEGRIKKRLIKYPTFEKVLGRMGNNEYSCVKSPAFKSLLTISANSDFVTGMFHEQFLEYLVAKYFVNSLESPNLPVNYLGLPINASINQFIKDIWQDSSPNKLRTILKRLKQVFLSANSGVSPTKTVIQANVAYYISRIPLKMAPKRVLIELLKESTDTYIINGILWGLVRLGSMNHEDNLYQSLKDNPVSNSINRGLHLEYFMDVEPKEKGTILSDNTTVNWSRTLLGLMQHIRRNEIRFLFTRRLDIFTIRSFIQSRKHVKPFKSDHFLEIDQSVKALANDSRVSTSFTNLVKSELEELRNILIRSNVI